MAPVAGLLAAGALLAGCSAPSVTGGDTTCKDYLAADEKTQTEAVTKMLKDEKGADPAQLEITATRAAVSTWCQTLGTPDTAIKNRPKI
jgi:acid stress chaperone HdeA